MGSPLQNASSITLCGLKRVAFYAILHKQVQIQTVAFSGRHAVRNQNSSHKFVNIFKEMI